MRLIPRTSDVRPDLEAKNPHPSSSLSLISSSLREDFCALAWGEDGILVTGGYDDVGSQRRTEVFNVTSGTWRQLAMMPDQVMIVMMMMMMMIMMPDQGRGLHSCAHWEGGAVVAGGWTLAEDEISYDISNDVLW